MSQTAFHVSLMQIKSLKIRLKWKIWQLKKDTHSTVDDG